MLFSYKKVLLFVILSVIQFLYTEILFSQNDKSNVIFIVTDDQGSLDLNSYGAKDLETPNIDALAESGVRFTQFYAPSSLCTPSRVGMLTGRYPQRSGMDLNAPSLEGESGLSQEEVTMADMLKKNGYVTGHIGKWHLGYTPKTMPNGQGFDYSFGHMGGCIDNYSHFYYWQGPNTHDLWRNGERIYRDGEYFPDLMVEEAQQFISTNKDAPFFLYFAMNLPHYPYQGEEKWLRYYEDLDYPRNLYAATISTIDERIGQVMTTLKDFDLERETIVIFQSDHGHSTEERAHFGGGYAGDFRGAKFSFFEGGIRVPSIISMPGTIPEGEVRDQIASGIDWFPTIAEFTGANLPDKIIDGKSLREVIMKPNTPSAHEALYWEFRDQWAVLEGDWKLIGNPRDSSNKGELTENDDLFLSNLKMDRSEMKNFRNEHPEIVQRLKNKYDQWMMDVNEN